MNIEDFLVKPITNKKVIENIDQFYTIFGMEDFIDDNGNPRQNTEKQNTFAKCINGNNYVKIGIDNRIHNPIGLFSEGQHNKVLQKVGKNQFNFKKVNSKVYNLYMSFLRTKNIAWLNNADRELL